MENLPNQTPHPSFAGGIHHVNRVLLAAPGTIVLRGLPNHLPAQRAVMDLARPAEDVVVVSYLVITTDTNKTAFLSINISAWLHFLRLYAMSNLVFR